MADIQTIHECLFCPQRFSTAVAKDDHILDHFARETCVECDRSLIRIGGSLYVKHDASICSIRVPKSEPMVRPCPTTTVSASAQNDDDLGAPIKIEQQDLAVNSTNSIDFDVLNKLENATPEASEDDNHSIAFGVELKLEEMLCKNETTIGSEQATEWNENDSMDAQDAVDAMDAYMENKEVVEAADERSKSQLQRSTQTNRMNRKAKEGFECDECDYVTTRKSNFIRHRLGKHGPNAKKKPDCPKDSKFECDLCGHISKKKSNLLHHMLARHVPNGKKFQCKLCNRSFLTVSNLKRHLCKTNPETTAKSTKSSSNQCDVCGRKMCNGNSMRKHRVLFHSGPNVIFCSVCAKIFSNVDERDKHQVNCMLNRRMRTRAEMGKFECDLCHKFYTTKAHIKKHIIGKHMPGGNKFKCKSCGRIFLSRHNQRNHNCKGKPVTPLSIRDKIPCETCGKILTRGAMKIHRLALHSPGTIYCRDCFKVFANTEELHSHRKQCKSKLRKERESPCHVCGKVLANPRALARHKISLHSEGIIFCRTCVKKFDTIDELNRHKVECTLNRRLQKLIKNQ